MGGMFASLKEREGKGKRPQSLRAGKGVYEW